MHKVCKIEIRAKINLSLQVKKLLSNGFHNLDMICCSIDLSDKICVKSNDSDRDRVFINGKQQDVLKMNVAKALKLIREKQDIDNVDIHIKSDILVGAGLGSSSADAAGIIAYYKKKGIITREDAYDIALKIGSDVPYMINGGTKRVQGQGEIITPLKYSEYHIILLSNNVPHSTKEIFDKFDKLDVKRFTNTEFMTDKIESDDFLDYLSNDLEQAAESLYPDFKKDLQIAKSVSKNFIMTGSGSCIIGVFKKISDAKLAYKKLKNNFVYAKIVKTKRKGIVL